MSKIIKVGILGWGNLGRGAALALRQNPDMELVGVFSRRDPETVANRLPGVPMYKVDRIMEFRDQIDVLMPNILM